jgi:hypothetical protein
MRQVRLGSPAGSRSPGSSASRSWPSGRRSASTPASTREAVGPEHLSPGPGAWLGTDALGRDLLARAIQGARVSLAVGGGAALGIVAIGGLLGALAGLRGGWTDRLLSGLTDAVAAVPPMVDPARRGAGARAGRLDGDRRDRADAVGRGVSRRAGRGAAPARRRSRPGRGRDGRRRGGTGSAGTCCRGCGRC